MKPWIDRQKDVTPEERVVYDVLDEKIYMISAPPYTLELARKIIFELDSHRLKLE